VDHDDFVDSYFEQTGLVFPEPPGFGAPVLRSDKFDYRATRWVRLFPKPSAGQRFRHLTDEPQPLRAVLILIPRLSRIYAVLLVCAILTHLVVVRDRASGSDFSAAWPTLLIAVTWQPSSAPLGNKETEMPREVQI
jgi:hypothetical protein